MLRRVTATAALAVLVAAPVACSGSGDGASSPDPDDFCELVLAIADGAIDFDATTDEGIQDTLDYYARIQEVAPDEVRDDLALVVEGIATATGPGTTPENAGNLQEADAALTRFNDFVEKECVADATPGAPDTTIGPDTSPGIVED